MKAIEILLSEIRPNPEQPRRKFDEDELEGLAQSIRENDVIQPVVVYKNGDGCYYLIDGERRWRAAKMAGKQRIAAVVRESAADHAGELALVANVQRADLSPLEEAQAYEKMFSKGLSHVEIASRCGVNHVTVKSRLALLKMEPEIQKLVDDGLLPIDKRVMEALQSVDAAHRVKMAQKLARPGIGIQTVVTACRKFNEALQASTQAQGEGGDGLPVMRYAVQRSGGVKRSHWDIFQEAGKVPPWQAVEAAARKTCNGCPMRDSASSVICRECPAVLMLVDLIAQVKDGR